MPRYWDKAAVTIDEGVPLVLATSASNAVLSDAGIVVTRFAIRFSAVKSACVRTQSMIAEKLGSGTLDVVRICWSQRSLLELPRAALQSKFRESERMCWATLRHSSMEMMLGAKASVITRTEDVHHGPLRETVAA